MGPAPRPHARVSGNMGPGGLGSEVRCLLIAQNRLANLYGLHDANVQMNLHEIEPLDRRGPPDVSCPSCTGLRVGS
jgi:hypothetical protein